VERLVAQVDGARRVRPGALDAGDRAVQAARDPHRSAGGGDADAAHPRGDHAQRRRAAGGVDAPDGARHRVGHPDGAVRVGDGGGDGVGQRHAGGRAAAREVDADDGAVERRRPQGPAAEGDRVDEARWQRPPHPAGGGVDLDDASGVSHDPDRAVRGDDRRAAGRHPEAGTHRDAVVERDRIVG
jgi:hypothetical protein